jgi:hypothetical protein
MKLFFPIFLIFIFMGSSQAELIPTLTIDENEMTSKGNLDKKIVWAFIYENRGAFKYCYSKELFQSPELKGKVGIQFEIDPLGNVGKTQIASSTIKNSHLEGCLLNVIRRVQFPRGSGTTEMKTNFDFQQTENPDSIDKCRKPNGEYICIESDTRPSVQSCQEKFGNVICTREYSPMDCRFPEDKPFGEMTASGSNRCMAINQLQMMGCQRGQTVQTEKITCKPTSP